MKASRIRSVPRKSRRPRPGFGFGLLRVAGWFFKIAGLLLVVLALAGCIFVLVKTWPTFFEAMLHFEQKSAGFYFFVVLGYFLVFMIIGLTGAVMAGIGLALGYWGTQPNKLVAEIKPAPVTTAQPNDHQETPGAT